MTHHPSQAKEIFGAHIRKILKTPEYKKLATEAERIRFLAEKLLNRDDEDGIRQMREHLERLPIIQQLIH